MSSFLKSVFRSGSATSSVLHIPSEPAAMSYTLAAFRWHMDTRPPVKLIALHDYLRNGAAWQQVMDRAIADLPLSRLSPTHPLEVYCADLRGHNYSEKLPMEAENSFPLACAADVVKMQREVLRSEAAVVGYGFGSLVACAAALHAPDAFSSLTLFVDDISQLSHCDPATYSLAEVINAMPKGTTSLPELNHFLSSKVKNPVERAILLSAVDVHDGMARFRYHCDILQKQLAAMTLTAPPDAKFHKPVTVILCNSNPITVSPESISLYQNFPNMMLKNSSDGKPFYSTTSSAIDTLRSCGIVDALNVGDDPNLPSEGTTVGADYHHG